MKIYQEKDYDALSRRAANLISAEVIRKPDCVLGLATGSTPVGTYRQLSAWNQKGDFSFKDVRTVNLDEYLGLPPTHAQSYRYFMDTNLFDYINIDKKNTFVASGMGDFEANARELEEKVREGGAADLVLFDDQTPYTVEKFHSKASNSPFVGAKLYGKVHYTICSGETVYRAE